jgi:hypothetical protein
MEINKQIRPEIRNVLDNYLLKLSAYLCENLLEFRDDMIKNAEIEIFELMDSITSAQLKQVLLELGTPEEYAFKLLKQLTGDKLKPK